MPSSFFFFYSFPTWLVLFFFAHHYSRCCCCSFCCCFSIPGRWNRENEEVTGIGDSAKSSYRRGRWNNGRRLSCHPIQKRRLSSSTTGGPFAVSLSLSLYFVFFFFFFITVRSIIFLLIVVDAGSCVVVVVVVVVLFFFFCFPSSAFRVGSQFSSSSFHFRLRVIVLDTVRVGHCRTDVVFGVPFFFPLLLINFRFFFGGGGGGLEWVG